MPAIDVIDTSQWVMVFLPDFLLCCGLHAHRLSFVGYIHEFLFWFHYTRGAQTVARGPHVACDRGLCGPWRLKEVTIIFCPQWALNSSADTETVVSVRLWWMRMSYFLTRWRVAGHSPVWWGRKVQAVFVATQLGLRPSTHCPFANLALWPKKFVHTCTTLIVFCLFSSPHYSYHK